MKQFGISVIAAVVVALALPAHAQRWGIGQGPAWSAGPGPAAQGSRRLRRR